MVPGRSKQVFKTWLASQPDTWRERIEIVAMDGFTGFKSAAAEELPGARAVMDPFPRRTPRRQRLGRVPQTHRARTPPPARALHGPPVQGPQGTAPQILPTHPRPAVPDTRPVFRRRARRPRGHLERLPEHHRRLPLIQRAWGQDFNARGNHAPHLHKRSLLPHRAHQVGQDTQTKSHRHPGLLRPPLARSRPNRLGSKPTTKSTSAQSSPSKGSCTNLKPSARPSPHSTSTAARTPQSPIPPRPGEPSSTTPPSTPTEQSPSRSTTARAFDRCGEWLHKLLAIISIRQLRRPDQELRNPDFFHTRRRVGSEFSLSHISEACLGTP